MQRAVTGTVLTEVGVWQRGTTEGRTEGGVELEERSESESMRRGSEDSCWVVPRRAVAVVVVVVVVVLGRPATTPHDQRHD